MSDTTPLPARDQHHLRAAEGWLELGDWRSANDELENVTPALRAHTDVLAMRWQVYSEPKHWELALVVAEALCDLVPGDANAWIHRSFAPHALKRTVEAEALLLPALGRFPDEPTVPYNLACSVETSSVKFLEWTKAGVLRRAALEHRKP